MASLKPPFFWIDTKSRSAAQPEQAKKGLLHCEIVCDFENERRRELGECPGKMKSMFARAQWRKHHKDSITHCGPICAPENDHAPMAFKMLSLAGSVKS